ncbi:MAG: DUF4412 domain-containing protein [Woeseia sp.]
MRLRILLLLLALHSPAFADIEMQFDDGSVGLVKDNMVLFGDSQSALLYNSRNDELILISREERSWLRVEADFVSFMTAQIEKDMEQMLSSVPPDQRAMVAEQLQGMMPQPSDKPPTVDVRRTGKTDRVAGYNCHEAEVSVAGSNNPELVCVATPSELGMDETDFATLNSAMRSIAEIAAMNPAAGPGADFSRMGGVPIRTHNLEQDYRTTLTAIVHGDIDNSRLAVPADFTETNLEEMFTQ